MTREQIIRDCIMSNPLPLLGMQDEEVSRICYEVLPYSTGFEIECEMQAYYNKKAFENIPNIMHVNVDSYEQRYRIPTGLKGILCLYTISQQLKLNSLLNAASGIHYHIDCTDTTSVRDIITNQSWILDELDSWDYKGTYNARKIYNLGGAAWLRWSSEHKTMEFRLGEMTFDYELLIKRIAHLNDIVRRVKDIAGYSYNTPPFKEIEITPIIRYISDNNDIYSSKLAKLREDLKKLEIEEEEENKETPIETMLNKISKRVIKLDV